MSLRGVLSKIGNGLLLFSLAIWNSITKGYPHIVGRGALNW